MAVPCSMIRNPEHRKLFAFERFNPVQSQCFDDIYNSDQSFVVSAPTGAGKTVSKGSFSGYARRMMHQLTGVVRVGNPASIGASCKAGALREAQSFVRVPHEGSLLRKVAVFSRCEDIRGRFSFRVRDWTARMSHLALRCFEWVSNARQFRVRSRAADSQVDFGRNRRPIGA